MQQAVNLHTVCGDMTPDIELAPIGWNFAFKPCACQTDNSIFNVPSHAKNLTNSSALQDVAPERCDNFYIGLVAAFVPLWCSKGHQGACEHLLWISIDELAKLAVLFCYRRVLGLPLDQIRVASLI